MFSKKSKAGVLIVLIFQLTVFAPRASGKTETEIREQIQSVLEQRHPKDTPQWWRALGTSAPHVIITMYEEGPQIYYRLRLVEALAWFPDSEEAVEFLKQQAELTQDSVVRNAAVKSVGISQGGKEAEFVSKYLQHPDPQTRLAAAQTLEKMNDPTARGKLDKYMSEEKTPWIVSRLRGEMPKPTHSLNPVSSSEDRLSPLFYGTWKGFWIVPDEGSSGLVSEAVELRIRKEDSPTSLKGELLLKSKDSKKETVRSLSLGNAQGKGTQITGVLPSQISTKSPLVGLKSQDFPFQAEILERAGAVLMELHAPKIGGVMVVRREPGATP